MRKAVVAGLIAAVATVALLHFVHTRSVARKEAQIAQLHHEIASLAEAIAAAEMYQLARRELSMRSQIILGITVYTESAYPPIDEMTRGFDREELRIVELTLEHRRLSAVVVVREDRVDDLESRLSVLGEWSRSVPAVLDPATLDGLAPPGFERLHYNVAVARKALRGQ